MGQKPGELSRGPSTADVKKTAGTGPNGLGQSLALETL